VRGGLYLYVSFDVPVRQEGLGLANIIAVIRRRLLALSVVFPQPRESCAYEAIVSYLR